MDYVTLYLLTKFDDFGAVKHLMLCTNFLANGYYTLHENRDYNLKVHVIE